MESSGQPGALPKVFAKTSGERLDPPIPRSSTRANPSERISFAKASISSTCSAMSEGLESQPRRFAISLGPGFQTV